MEVFITNKDGSMFVHALSGISYVSWVSKDNKENAMRFPDSVVDDWIKIITNTTGVECISTTAQRRGML